MTGSSYGARLWATGECLLAIASGSRTTTLDLFCLIWLTPLSLDVRAFQLGNVEFIVAEKPCMYVTFLNIRLWITSLRCGKLQ
jgi:hypothetical protein